MIVSRSSAPVALGKSARANSVRSNVVRTNATKEVASLAAALLVVSSAVETPTALAGPELSQSSPLLERYNKVKTSEKVVGAKAVLNKKVESARQAAVNAPKPKASSVEGGFSFSFFNFKPSTAPQLSASPAIKMSPAKSAAVDVAGAISPATATNISLGAGGLAVILLASIFAGKGPAADSPAALAAAAAKRTEEALARARAGQIKAGRPWY